MKSSAHEGSNPSPGTCRRELPSSGGFPPLRHLHSSNTPPTMSSKQHHDRYCHTGTDLWIASFIQVSGWYALTGTTTNTAKRYHFNDIGNTAPDLPHRRQLSEVEGVIP